MGAVLLECCAYPGCFRQGTRPNGRRWAPLLKKVLLVTKTALDTPRAAGRSATRWFRLLFLGLLSELSACSDPEPPKEPVLSGVATDSVCPAGSTLTYESWASDFFASYCTRCHSKTREGDARNGAPDGYNWDDVNSVRAHQSQIDLMAAASVEVVNHEMPPSDPRPPTSERRKLGEWLACGAP